jgi:hypothetical protein
VTAAHGWSIAQVSSAITSFFLVSATCQIPVGRGIGMQGLSRLGTFRHESSPFIPGASEKLSY